VKQQLAGNGSTSAAERIERASRQMARQIEDLLDAHRIEQGNFRLKLAPADLAGVLDDAIAGVTPAAQARSLRLEREVLGDAALTCDAGRIAQVFANLLHNAVKFSVPGGTVRVRLEGAPSGVEFSVRDSGPGIREEDLGRLFERHWQASDSAHLGTGLGLFICRSIVAAHGGDISAQSSAEGATFRVRLPREGAGAA